MTKKDDIIEMLEKQVETLKGLVGEQMAIIDDQAKIVDATEFCLCEQCEKSLAAEYNKE